MKYNRCPDHGGRVELKGGVIYCKYCGEKIPLNKLKKKKKR